MVEKGRYSGTNELKYKQTFNPASERLNAVFTTNKTTVLKIEIYDLNGALLFSTSEKRFEPGSYTETVPMSSKEIRKLVKGLYLCKIRTNEKTVSKSFIIQ